MMFPGQRITKQIFFISGLLIISILYGYLVAVKDPQAASLAVGKISAFGNLRSFNPFLLFLLIFFNNSIKAFFVLVLGFFFGLAPIFFIFLNGYVIGLVVSVIGKKVGFLKVLAGLLPHGVLEIPAIVLAASYGLWLGMCFLRKVRSEEPFREKLSYAFKKFFTVVLPLLFVAAAVEAYISTAIVEKLK